MSKPDNNKQSIFQKILEAGEVAIDSYIFKAKTTIINSNVEDEFFYGKAVVEDPSYSLHSQGWTDKPYRIQNSHLKYMSYQDSAIAAVIQTRQNQVASYSKLSKSEQQKGWMIKLKDEDAMLAKIVEELRAEKDLQELADQPLTEGAPPAEDAVPDVQKADPEQLEDETSSDGAEDANPQDNSKSDDEVEEYDFELHRKAKDKLEKQFEKAKKAVEDYVKNAGKLENRPFETKKWNFENCLRAWVRDTLTYDMYGSEVVPDLAKKPHHFFPVDGGTIKYASKDLRKYKDSASNFSNIDILYPENSEEAKERSKVIELDQDLLDKDAYKYVQVIRGKVERAYTADELKVGIRNVNTDIYNNGYGISELELLVSMVTGHLNAEYYNQAYFTQGFSAKGILHIKAAINRRKLETVRMQWQHMLKGSRNSFQTPIFAGVEDVKWLPLTQNHNDIGFEGWMRYVITMIGAIYQIDPAEMGMHFKAEGQGGSLGAKDGTNDKIHNSKDKGLYPLLTHFQTYLNDDIVKPFDARFELKFTGADGMDAKLALERQEKEVKFKKTVNEIRAEDGLPPLPGMDEMILDPTYMQWFMAFSKKALEKEKRTQDQAMKQSQMQMDQQAQASGQEQQDENAIPPEEDLYGEGALHMNMPEEVGKSLNKSKPLVVEVYKIEK